MTHLFAPRSSEPEIPVFFNVDEGVGANPARNIREDVLLVQFAFEVIARRPVPSTPPEVLATAKLVRSTSDIDPATTSAIFAFRRNRPSKEIIVDGRVSPARGDGYSYGGGALWTIVHLNNSIQNRYVDDWPRIDRIPGCPAELKTDGGSKSGRHISDEGDLNSLNYLA